MERKSNQTAGIIKRGNAKISSERRPAVWDGWTTTEDDSMEWECVDRTSKIAQRTEELNDNNNVLK